MSGVQTITIGAAEAEMRLDRWLSKRYPGLSHGHIQKLLRTGQVRVDGGRVKPQRRLGVGEIVRVPPLDHSAYTERPKPSRTAISSTLADDLAAAILFQDDDVLVINKPHGLAVQGGSGLDRHLDAWLDSLGGGDDRPRLVHRLDKDTSGVLLIAKRAAVAGSLTKAFRDRTTRKEYWAVTVGVPKPAEGKIVAPLAKMGRAGNERVAVDEKDGKRASTAYAVIERVGKRAAWLAVEPLTGRTHQLRVHLATIGTPILGDGKYGMRDETLEPQGKRHRLHLHARRLRLPHPRGGLIDVTAPLPPHMRESWGYFGFQAELAGDPFADIKR